MIFSLSSLLVGPITSFHAITVYVGHYFAVFLPLLPYLLFRLAFPWDVSFIFYLVFPFLVGIYRSLMWSVSCLLCGLKSNIKALVNGHFKAAAVKQSL